MTTQADVKRHRAARRRAAMKAGTWESPMTTPDRARAHIARLQEFGLSEVAIARLAGEPDVGSLSDLTRPGSRRYVTRITKAREARILAARFDLDAIDNPDRKVHVAGTRRRIEGLRWMGWTNEHIAARVGVTSSAVSEWTKHPVVKVRTARRVRDVYDELSMTRGPSKITATRARTAGFAPPLAWDDDTIDDPAATPDRGAFAEGIGRDDIVWLVSFGDVRTWDHLVERTGSKKSSLRVALRRAGREDLIDRLDVATYGVRMVAA